MFFKIIFNMQLREINEISSDNQINLQITILKWKYNSDERILVFPAASRPNIKILISLLPNIFDNSFPILTLRQSL